MRSLLKWRTIVKEDSVKIVTEAALFFKMRERKFKGCLGDNLRIVMIFMRIADSKPAQEETTVNQDGCWHTK